jgi:O-antigen ligase
VRRFVAVFGFLLMLFLGWSALGIAVYAAEPGPHVERQSWAQLLSLAAVGLPLAFLTVTSLLPLKRGQAVFAIRVLLVLGGATGLIMIVFALFPARIVSMLGWAGAIAGTGELARGRTPLGHPVTVTAVLTVLMPVAVMMGLCIPGWKWRAASLASALVMFGGILFSLSRASLAVTLPILLLTVLYAALRPPVCNPQSAIRNRNRRGMFPFLFLAGLAAGALALLAQYDFSRLWSRGYYEEASIERRMESIQTALVVWRDHFLLGVGPDTVYPRLDFRPAWVSLGEDGVSELIAYGPHLSAPHPHNLYVQALAEYGLVGAALLMCMGIAVWTAFVRLRRSLRHDRQASALLTSFLLALLAVAGLGLGAPLFLLEFRAALVVSLLLGLGIAYGQAAEE